MEHSDSLPLHELSKESVMNEETIFLLFHLSYELYSSLSAGTLESSLQCEPLQSGFIFVHEGELSCYSISPSVFLQREVGVQGITQNICEISFPIRASLTTGDQWEEQYREFLQFMKEAALVNEVRESSFGGLGCSKLVSCLFEGKILRHWVAIIN